MADRVDDLYAELTLLVTSSVSGRHYATRIRHLHTHKIDLSTPIGSWQGAVYIIARCDPTINDVIDGYRLFYEDHLVNTHMFNAISVTPGDTHVDLQYICHFEGLM